MNEIRFLVQLLIDAHQHGRRLAPGGGGIRGKGGGRGAVCHTDGIGDGDVALPALHVGEGQRILFFGNGRRLFQAQRPHQNLRHLPPGHRVVGPERHVRIHHIVLHGKVDGVQIAAGQRLGNLHGGRDMVTRRMHASLEPAQHPAHHRHELGPGHGVRIAEDTGAVSVHQAVAGSFLHLRGQSAARWYIRIGRGGHGHHKRRGQGQRRQAGQKSFHGSLSLSLMYFPDLSILKYDSTWSKLFVNKP